MFLKFEWNYIFYRKLSDFSVSSGFRICKVVFCVRYAAGNATTLSQGLIVLGRFRAVGELMGCVQGREPGARA